MRTLFRLAIFLAIHIFGVHQTFAQSTAVKMYLGEDSGLTDQEVSLDVTLDNFVDIVSLQASLNWDASLLQYQGVSNFGLEGFSQGNFGENTVDQGHLRFLWTPADAMARSLSDSSILFTVVFKVVAAENGTTEVDFVDKTSAPPFQIEFANKDYEILEVTTTTGNVEVIADPKALVQISASPNTLCNSLAWDGRLLADVSVHHDDFEFLWFAGLETSGDPLMSGPFLDSIAPGSYSLQINYVDGTVFVDQMIAEVEDLSPGVIPALELSSQPNNYCSKSKNGAAEAMVSNISGNALDYYWFLPGDQLDTLQSRSNMARYDSLGQGQYICLAVDRISTCMAVDTIQVMDEEIYTEVTITQRADTLFSNQSESAWFYEMTPLNVTSNYYLTQEDGNYHVTLVNEYGCLSESEPYYFGITGLLEKASQIAIYPNPFFEHLIISNQDQKLDLIEIFDNNGVLIYKNSNVKDRFIRIDLTGFSSSVYIVRMQSGAQTLTRKVIKSLP